MATFPRIRKNVHAVTRSNASWAAASSSLAKSPLNRPNENMRALLFGPQMMQCLESFAEMTPERRETSQIQLILTDY